MPVEDHPVHEKTRIGKDFRYGCFDRDEYNKGYWAPDRVWGDDGQFTVGLKWIPYKMSRGCLTAETGQALTDPNCQGCKWINRASSPAQTQSGCSTASETAASGGQ